MNQASPQNTTDPAASKIAQKLYLDLMKRCVMNWIYGDENAKDYLTFNFIKRRISELLSKCGLKVLPTKPFNEALRAEGRDWPVTAHSMIGRKRLDNLQTCVEDIIEQQVPGDLIEAGVWRGGASIFMRAVLKAYDILDRRVWLADSFEGLPKPDVYKYPADILNQYHVFKTLSVSEATVRKNFERYDLLDEQVQFLRGWFKDTLPNAPFEELALMRLDGDLYESTMDSLKYLYPKLSLGGYVIIDDYGCVPACRKAVEDFRASNQIDEPIVSIDWTGAYWKRVR